MDRRTFLKSVAGLTATGMLPLHGYAQQHKGRVKITDVKCMIVRGTWDWNLIKIETDSGVYGIGEAYWGWGVKDLVINKLRPIVVGEDPLNVDKLYTKMLMESAGAGALAGVTVTAVSGIEIALWDLAGRILQTPACNLLGGRFRDRVRFYRTMPAVADPDYKEPGHDRYTRGLTLKDLRRIGRAMEIVREELGPDVDFGVEAHWKYDVRDAIQMAKAIEPVKPMWLEDPVPPGNLEAMARVTHAVDVPICTGENLYTRDGFRRLIELQGCDIVHIDIPKSGGLLEAKRIHDLADNYYISTAAHNPASPVGTIASCHAAASMRDFRVHELARYIDWWQDLVIHDGPMFQGGYFTIQDKPGYGIEINPDVAKAHLAPGETWWG
jgi:L-alanine-DL-glutamate epimerase-like enolase superfamily enzyme